jgi:hypothetical protein
MEAVSIVHELSPTAFVTLQDIETVAPGSGGGLAVQVRRRQGRPATTLGASGRLGSPTMKLSTRSEYACLAHRPRPAPRRGLPDHRPSPSGRGSQAVPGADPVDPRAGSAQPPGHRRRLPPGGDPAPSRWPRSSASRRRPAPVEPVSRYFYEPTPSAAARRCSRCSARSATSPRTSWRAPASPIWPGKDRRRQRLTHQPRAARPSGRGGRSGQRAAARRPAGRAE